MRTRWAELWLVGFFATTVGALRLWGAENTPPSIGPISAVTVYRGADPVTLPLEIRDAETPLGTLTLSATINRSGLLDPLADPNLAAVFRDGRWELTIRHATTATGSATIAVTVEDAGGLRTTESFVFEVRQGPLSVQIATMPPQRLWQGGVDLTVDVPMTYVGADRPILDSWSSRAELVKTLNAFRSSESIASVPVVRLTPSANQEGAALVTVRARYTTVSVQESFDVIVQKGLFEPETAALPPGLATATEMVSADMDRDGTAEWVISSDGLRIFRRKDVGWNEIGGVRVAGVPADLGIVDVDRDGRPDVYGRVGFVIHLWRNLDDSGKIRLVQVPLPSMGQISPQRAVWGDLTGDGRVDGLVVGAQTAVLLKNTGSGFEAHDLGIQTIGPRMALADMDRDGDLDIVALRRATVGAGTFREIGVWTNDGRGGIGVLPEIAYSTIGTTALAQLVDVGIADVDGDGRMEIWCLSRESPVAITVASRLVILKEGLQGFAKVHEVATDAVSGSQFVWGDFDSDGLTDLVHPVGRTLVDRLSRPDPANERIEHWRGTFRGVLELESNLRAKVTRLAMLPGHNPDRLDVGASNFVFRNVHTRPNIRPSAPGELSSISNGRRVRFSWGDAFDINQISGLTYNLRVGTSSGADDVVASHSLATGARLVSAPGNVGANRFTELDLGYLGPRILYWSVQAVDASYAGSAFSEESAVTDLLSGPGSVVTLRMRPTANFPLTSYYRVDGVIRPPRAFRLQESSDLVEWRDVSVIQPRADGLFEWIRRGEQSGQPIHFLRATGLSDSDE